MSDISDVMGALATRRELADRMTAQIQELGGLARSTSNIVGRMWMAVVHLRNEPGKAAAELRNVADHLRKAGTMAENLAHSAGELQTAITRAMGEEAASK